MESKLWTEEAVVNLELVTVWSPGREGEEERRRVRYWLSGRVTRGETGEGGSW